MNKPWIPLNKEYNGSSYMDNLNSELNDLYEWLRPTEAENHLRKLTVLRYITFIESVLPNSYVVLQGSSATDTFLSDSDIDLIIFFKENSSDPPANKIHNIEFNFQSLKHQKHASAFKTEPLDHISILETIAREFRKTKMVNDIKIITTARVPIIKTQDKHSHLDIDICVSNFDGVVLTNCLLSFLRSDFIHFSKEKYHQLKQTLNPNTLKKLIFILKIFIHLNKLESPFEGGFGSTEIVHFALFITMMHPGENNLATLLLSFFELIGRQLNYFLCGLSIQSNWPHFISKISHSLLTNETPQSLIIQNWSDSSSFFGTKTKKTIQLSYLCNHALCILNNITNNNLKNKTPGKSFKSLVSFILPDLSSYIEIRNKQESNYRMLIKCDNTSTLQWYNQSSSDHRISYPKFDLDTKTTLLITNSTDSSQTLSGFAKIQQKFQLKSTNSNERNRSQTADNSVVHMNSTVHVLQSEKNITTPPPTKCDFAHGSEQKSPFWFPSLDNKKVIKPHLPYRR